MVASCFKIMVDTQSGPLVLITLSFLTLKSSEHLRVLLLFGPNSGKTDRNVNYVKRRAYL